MRTTEADRLLDVFDVASCLGVSVATVRRMIGEGQIPAFQMRGRLGGAIRVRESDLDRLVQRWEVRSR